MLLYSGTQEGEIGIWDVNDAGLSLVCKVSGHDDIVRGMKRIADVILNFYYNFRLVCLFQEERMGKYVYGT